MRTFKTVVMILVAILMIGGVPFYVLMDILLHPEKENYYRLNPPYAGARPIPHAIVEDGRNRILSDEHAQELNQEERNIRVRTERLINKLNSLKELREQKEAVYHELVELKNEELKFSIYTLLLSYVIGVVSSISASLFIFMVSRRRNHRWS